MDKTSDPTKKIRIVDVARMAGVSVGTVDRVIHNRGRVSEENLRKVKGVLDIVDYQPNLIARSLASRKQYRIVTLTPEAAPGEYWKDVHKGIGKAAAETTGYNIHVENFHFNQYDAVSFDRAQTAMLEKEFDAAVIATLFTEPVIRLSRLLDKRKIPYVYLDSNIAGQNQLSYFGTESYDAGAIAARLLTEKIARTSDILVCRIIHSGENDSTQIRNRKKGFCDFLEKNGYAGKLRYAHLRLNDDAYNFEVLDKVFAEPGKIEGAVTFNSTCYIPGKYLKAKRLSQVNLVGYDVTGRNADMLRDGVVIALIAQRPEYQGYYSIKALYEKLLFGKRTDKVNLMPIDILIRENIAYNHNIF